MRAIIGANFGDEGKGLMTDYFASQMGDDGIVVRFNGGAQAAHTVQTPEGKRHAFGHFGSGTFAKVPTFLSSFFVVNPLLFNKECTKLRWVELRWVPKIYVDQNCLVTLPVDMFINQIVEKHRGENRHGSCGVGFNETIHRSNKYFKLTVGDFINDRDFFIRRLIYSTGEYFYERLLELKLPDLAVSNVRNIIDNYPAYTTKFVDYMVSFLNQVEVVDVNFLKDKDLLFEGAQGLLLAQDNYEYFPHVTRSHTGIRNVANLLEQLDRKEERLYITYVTRAYMTRHGAGPFPSETEGKPFQKIEDPTNVPNEFQGAMRFGLLDLKTLEKSILRDAMCAYEFGLNFSKSLALTCLDQLEYEATYCEGEDVKKLPVSLFINEVLSAADCVDGYLSYGPTRDTINLLN